MNTRSAFITLYCPIPNIKQLSKQVRQEPRRNKPTILTRAAKTNIDPADPTQVLEGITDMEVAT